MTPDAAALPDELPDALAVVGTDTGVGKTVVTAGLVGWLRAEGVDARAVKPVQTGYPPDDDAGYVQAACDDEDAATCLERLEPPLAPAVAADREGVELEYDALLAGCRDALADAEVGVLEGVGGLRVPLATRGGGEWSRDRRPEVLDLVADLGVPALVVARSGLGTLNHSGLTVGALDRRDVPVLGVVLNDYEGASVAERTNPGVLARMTGRRVVTLPRVDLADPTAAVALVRSELPADLLS